MEHEDGEIVPTPLYNRDKEKLTYNKVQSKEDAIHALSYYGGNVQRSAKALSVSRRTLDRFINANDLRPLLEELRLNKQLGLREKAIDVLDEALDTQHPEFDRQEANKIALKPVSYTHLTLPTKRIV